MLLATTARAARAAAARAAPALAARAAAGTLPPANHPVPAAAAAAATAVARWTTRGFAADAAVDDVAPPSTSTVAARLVDAAGTPRGTAHLPADVFAAPVRTDILHRVIRWQQAKARAGTGAAKNRAAVRGGGRKPWRQKGTGRARAGSTRSPLWTGGGKAHPPTPRSFEHGCNRRVRRAALAAALSARAAEGRLVVVEGELGGDGKTQTLLAAIRAILPPDARTSALLADAAGEAGGAAAPAPAALARAAANVPSLDVLPPSGLNPLSILKRDWLVMSRVAVDAAVARVRAPIRR